MGVEGKDKAKALEAAAKAGSAWEESQKKKEARAKKLQNGMRPPAAAMASMSAPSRKAKGSAPGCCRCRYAYSAPCVRTSRSARPMLLRA